MKSNPKQRRKHRTNIKEKHFSYNYFFDTKQTCIKKKKKKKYKEKWMSDPQRLYKRGFQSLTRREKGILLKSLQFCNQIATHNLILSHKDSTFASTSSKIRLFRSAQMAQKVAVDTTFHKTFPLLLRQSPRPKQSNSLVDLGITHNLPNSFKIFYQRPREKSQ